MSPPTQPFAFVIENESVAPKAHYESLVYDTLATVWARKPLIAAVVLAAFVFASIALVLMGPRYTAEATILLNFVREESATGPKSMPTAALDAMAVVDSLARIVRSRATAGAVVDRLGLDKDSSFARQTHSWRIFFGLRSDLGLMQTVPSDRDLAVQQLMGRVTVTTDPKSYLILVSVTASDPKLSAKLANAVAIEYLRGQLMQQTVDAYAAVEREVAELSSIYGAHHPAYLNGQAKLEGVRLRLRALREGTSDEDIASRVTGQSFVAAQEVLVPSGPNIVLILGLTVGAAFAAGTWLALLRRPRRPLRSEELALVTERSLESIRQ
jgi:uncharacterized protein involved in exopolysaccharide biosynthesis